MSLPPWLNRATASLVAARRQGRLPTALLIHEEPGAGGALLARFFSQLALCEKDPAPCGACRHCERVTKQEHPDLLFIGPDPELKSGQISVDQIRELSSQLATSSFEGRGTVVVIAPAENMTDQAQNALLKTLEEPRRDAHLVLLTAQLTRLLPTIRSRCQKLRALAPERSQALSYLQQAQSAPQGHWEAALEVLGVAPLEAAQMDPGALFALRAEVHRLLNSAATQRLDVVRLAESWAKDDFSLRLRAIENCITSRVLANATGKSLSEGEGAFTIAASLGLLERVSELRQQLTKAALSKPLAAERLFWRLDEAGLQCRET
jgi:DNA polymerase III subunit delta'